MSTSIGRQAARKTAGRWLMPLLLCGGMLSGLLIFSRCFSPVLATCSYRCNTSDLGTPACPDSYECRSDGYCHMNGTSEACPFTMDLSPAPAVDMTAAPSVDMTAPPGSDLMSSSDMPKMDM